MSRSYVVFLFASFLLTSCTAGAGASATAPAPTALPEATAASVTAVPSPAAIEPSPAAEQPPKDVVVAALAICVSPECQYPRLFPGSVHLQPEMATAADRWCVQAHFTMEGKDQLVAILLIQEAGGATAGWQPGEPQVGVGCETVK